MSASNSTRIPVLFIVPSLRRAGAETQIVDLVNGLDPETFQIHLLAFQPYLDQLDRVNQDHVTFHHVQRKGKLDWSIVRKVAELIDQFSIGIVHTTLQYSLLYGWLGRVFSKHKPAMIAAIHTTISADRKEEFQNRFVYQWLLRCCDHVVFVCNKQRTYWLEKYPFLMSISSVIYNGVDPAVLDPECVAMDASLRRAELNIPGDAFVIACIAAFRKEKGHHFLVQAVNRLDANVYTVFAGDGELRSSIEKQVEEAGLEQRVRFLGVVNDIRAVLCMADLSVLASTAVETFSMAMLESLAMQVPVVGSDIGGMSEAVIPGKTGFLVRPGDVDDLTAKRAEITGDRPRATEMGAAGRRLVMQSFNREKMITGTTQLLQQVAGTAIPGT
jgi:glycosyltransferase involved in cell wall biosynthesis